MIARMCMEMHFAERTGMMTIYVGRYSSPLGDMTLAGTGRMLTGLWFDGQAHYGAALTGAEQPGAEECFEAARAWLDAYFSGRRPGAAPELMPAGTEFCRRIWTLLCEIPYGTTVTYGELARRYEVRTGRRTGARAVGMAVGRNPISIMIPCHRVLGADGKLTGYAGGLERKRALLMLERGMCRMGLAGDADWR